MSKKKNKQDPVAHEEQYILFLEAQIKFYKSLPEPDKAKIEKFKAKLAKARLILKLLKK